MSTIKTKILAGTMLLLPLSLKTCRNAAKYTAQKSLYEMRAAINKISKPDCDTFVLSDSTAKSVLKEIADNEAMTKKTTKIVQRNFDSDDTRFLMNNANTPLKQTYLCKTLNENNKRKEKLSAYTISYIAGCDQKDQLNFNIKLINAKQKNGKYYSEDEIRNIIYTMKLNQGPLTFDIANYMLKNKYPEEIIPTIIQSTHSFDMKEDLNKKELAFKLLESKGKYGKAQFTPEQILQKITDYKLPMDE